MKTNPIQNIKVLQKKLKPDRTTLNISEYSTKILLVQKSFFTFLRHCFEWLFSVFPMNAVYSSQYSGVVAFPNEFVPLHPIRQKTKLVVTGLFCTKQNQKEKQICGLSWQKISFGLQIMICVHRSL